MPRPEAEVEAEIKRAIRMLMTIIRRPHCIRVHIINSTHFFAPSFCACNARDGSTHSSFIVVVAVKCSPFFVRARGNFSSNQRRTYLLYLRMKTMSAKLCVALHRDVRWCAVCHSELSRAIQKILQICFYFVIAVTSYVMRKLGHQKLLKINK